jgi:hypothetical protein
MSNFWGTLRHAVRMFRLNPGFTFAAVAAWVLGIGSPRAAKQARQEFLHERQEFNISRAQWAASVRASESV